MSSEEVNGNDSIPVKLEDVVESWSNISGVAAEDVRLPDLVEELDEPIRPSQPRKMSKQQKKHQKRMAMKAASVARERQNDERRKAWERSPTTVDEDAKALLTHPDTLGVGTIHAKIWELNHTGIPPIEVPTSCSREQFVIVGAIVNDLHSKADDLIVKICQLNLILKTAEKHGPDAFPPNEKDEEERMQDELLRSGQMPNVSE